MARLLTNRKLDVVQAGSATEALQAAGAQLFDLIISDIGLPDVDGLELMRKLKPLQSCPAIALSGYGSAEDVARSRSAGYAIHLTKPLLSQSLDDALRQFSLGRPAASS